MLKEQLAPVAAREFAPVFVALELSRAKWLVGVGTPQQWTVRRHQVAGGDVAGLAALLRRIGAGEEQRSGRPARVHVCFEAGRDGHWLHRALQAAGYDVYEIEPASVAVDRRARRVKSDGVDVDKLVRTLARLLRGEFDACRVVVVPSEAEEDAKRPHREYERLVKERTGHCNRIKALLFAQGIRDFAPMAPDRLQRLAALPIMPRLKAELSRECRRLATVIDDLNEAEAEMAASVIAPDKATAKRAAVPMPDPLRTKVAQLFRLKSLGVHFSTVLGGEVYYRTFQNRRKVAQYLGLAPSPFQSGDKAREQGCGTSPTARSPNGSGSASATSGGATGASPSSPWRANWPSRCGATSRAGCSPRAPSSSAAEPTRQRATASAVRRIREGPVTAPCPGRQKPAGEIGPVHPGPRDL